MSVCLVLDSISVANSLQYLLRALLFVCALFFLFLLFVVVSGVPSRIKGESLSTASWFKPPVILLLAAQGGYSVLVLWCVVISCSSCYPSPEAEGYRFVYVRKSFRPSVRSHY